MPCLTGHWSLFVNALWHLTLPAVVLSFGAAAVIMRMTRSSLLEVLGRQYVRTAKAKGLGYWRVVLRHGLRNALLPTVTVLGLQFGYLLGGTVLVEYIFSWPGIGLYTAQSITSSDYPAVMGVTVLIAFMYVLVNLLVDVCYAAINPRIRLAKNTMRMALKAWTTEAFSRLQVGDVARLRSRCLRGEHGHRERRPDRQPPAGRRCRRRGCDRRRAAAAARRAPVLRRQPAQRGGAWC